MKVKIEPIRLRDIISTGLIAKGQTALLDSTMASFTPKTVAFRDVTLEDIAVYAIYSKKYFTEYDVPEDEDVPVSSFTLKKLNYGFKKDEQIIMRTEDIHLILEGKAQDELYKEKMTDLAKVDFPIPMKVTEYGLLPEKLLPIEDNMPILMKISAESLSVPKADKYTFTCDGKSLRMKVEDEVSEYSKAYTPKKVVKMGELTTIFDAQFFGCVASNLTGEIWLGMCEEMATFSQKSENSAVTILLVSREI